jgi:hypothetical protein
MDTIRTAPTGHAASDAGATTWSTIDGLDIAVGPAAAGQRRVGRQGASVAVDLADLVHERSDWAAAERRAAIGALFAGLTRGLLRLVGLAADRVAAAGRGLTARRPGVRRTARNPACASRGKPTAPRAPRGRPAAA